MKAHAAKKQGPLPDKRQKGIAGFFTAKPATNSAASLPTAPCQSASMPEHSVLRESNGERKRERQETASDVAVPSADGSLPKKGLKRLKKLAPDEGAKAEAMAVDSLEDVIEDVGTPADKGGISPVPSQPQVLSTAVHDPIEEDIEEAAPSTARQSAERDGSASPVENKATTSSAGGPQKSRGPGRPRSPRQRKGDPTPSGVDDPIDDSEDDGSGPKEAAPIGGSVKRARAKKGTAAPRAVTTGASKKDAKKKQLEEAGADREEIDDLEAASESEVEAQEEEEEAVKKPLKKAVLKYPSKIAKVEGVGAGALAAAANHEGFDPEKLATWGKGEPVPFSFLADTFEAIGEEPKRLKILHLLVKAFRAILVSTPEDLLPVVYLCTNRVAPAHEGLELGIGDATLIKALAQATGRQEVKVKADLAKEGDLGKVAAAARATQRTMFKPKPLMLRDVFRTFKEIALSEGNKSQEVKKRLINKLLVSSNGNEPGYIIRALQGKLRIGLAEQTVLVALGHAVVLQRDGAGNKDGGLAGRMEMGAQAVKQAYSECPSYDKLIPALLEHPIAELDKHVHFMPGVPVKPMLAKPTNGISEVLDKVQDTEFTVEYKYDGERAQIHIMDVGKTVNIYSRNSENNTNKYPDITATISQLLKPGVTSIVLDCEAVAYDRVTQKVLPFQVLSTRKRTDVKLEEITVQVCLFAFDCLYLNGVALLPKPLTERREALYTSMEEREGQLRFAIAKTSREPEELELFLNEAVAAGTEGLIVKTLDSTYEPSKRSAHWLKLKKDYLEGVGDTFDVVPIGAWYGRGKRVGVYGAYLLAIYNEDTEEFQTISKIGTGFSEKALEELATTLRGHIIEAPRPYYTYGETLLPDIWFKPAVVWEVKAADLSVSPVHKAGVGLVDPNKGISIRFPRLVRVRDDKTPEGATGAEQVAEMYRRQASTQNHKAKEVDEDY